jgi:hypothetical protein
MVLPVRVGQVARGSTEWPLADWADLTKPVGRAHVALQLLVGVDATSVESAEAQLLVGLVSRCDNADRLRVAWAVARVWQGDAEKWSLDEVT